MLYGLDMLALTKRQQEEPLRFSVVSDKIRNDYIEGLPGLEGLGIKQESQG